MNGGMTTSSRTSQLKRLRTAGLAFALGTRPVGACGIGRLVDPNNNIANQIDAAIAADSY